MHAAPNFVLHAAGLAVRKSAKCQWAKCYIFFRHLTNNDICIDGLVSCNYIQFIQPFKPKVGNEMMVLRMHHVTA